MARLNTPETFGTVLPERALESRPRARAAKPTTALPAKPAFVPPRDDAGAAGAAAAQLLAAHRLRQVRLPLLSQARPAAADGHAAPARGGAGGRGGHRSADARLDRAPGARGDRLQRAEAAGGRGHPRVRRRRRRHALRRRARRRQGVRAGVRGLAAVRAPHPRHEHDERGVVRLRAGARRRRPARPRASSTSTPRRPTAPTWSSTTRPTTSPPRRRRRSTSPATTRRSASSTRSPRCGPARPRVDVAYCLLERPARAGHDDLHRRRRARAGRRAGPARPRPAHPLLRGHRHPAPRAVRRLPRPARALQLLAEQTLRPPPALWPGAPGRHTTPAGAPPAADPLLR